MSPPTTPDVLRAAWRAAGSPDTPGLDWAPGRCARCRAEEPVADAANVVSAKYAGWDRLVQDDGTPGMCRACAWGHRADGLRTTAHHVTPTVLAALDADGLRAVLSRAVPANEAVLVPVGRGRKHLMPDARWGLVTTDDALLPWTESDADRLAATVRLRAHGFTESDLVGDRIPADRVADLPSGVLDEVLDDWRRLAQWRDYGRPWLAVACRASRTPRRSA